MKCLAVCSFSSWSGSGIADTSSASTTVTMGNAAKTITANFTRNPPTPEYTLTINISPSGCGSASGADDYVANKVVDISASANPGCSFSSWSGSDIADTSSASTTVTMGSADKTITARFTRNTYTLDDNVSPTGGGSVSRSADSPYYYGNSVTLTASANPGYRFSHWSGDGTGTSTRTVTMKGNKRVTAHFSRIPTECPAGVFVNFEVGRSGSATLPAASGGGGGITYARGNMPDWLGFNSSTRVVSATPAKAGTWLFSIVATGSNGSSATCPHGVTARKIPYTLDDNVSPTGGGSVSLSPAGPYYYGAVVTLRASPSPGYRFARWSGDASGTSATTTVTMKENKRVTAHFTQIRYTLTVDPSPPGGGSVSRSPAGPYYYGDVVTLTASPARLHYLSSWSGAII